MRGSITLRLRNCWVIICVSEGCSTQLVLQVLDKNQTGLSCYVGRNYCSCGEEPLLGYKQERAHLCSLLLPNSFPLVSLLAVTNRESACKAEMWFASCQHQYCKAEDGKVGLELRNYIMTHTRRDRYISKECILPRDHPQWLEERQKIIIQKASSRAFKEGWIKQSSQGAEPASQQGTFCIARAGALRDTCWQELIFTVDTQHLGFLFFPFLNENVYCSFAVFFLSLQGDKGTCPDYKLPHPELKQKTTSPRDPKL